MYHFTGLADTHLLYLTFYIFYIYIFLSHYTASSPLCIFILFSSLSYLSLFLLLSSPVSFLYTSRYLYLLLSLSIINVYCTGPTVLLDSYGATEAAIFSILSSLVRQMDLEAHVDVFYWFKESHSYCITDLKSISSHSI